MFHQVNVEVLGMVENMSQMTLPDGTVIDVFGAGRDRANGPAVWPDVFGLDRPLTRRCGGGR